MKSKTLRAVIGGSVAAVMALSISLPLQADAAPESQKVTLKATSFAQFMEYLKQYSTNGFSFDASTVIVTRPVAAVPTATAKPAATPAATAAPAVSDATGTASFTQQIVTLVNKERAAVGLSPVAALDSLNKVAAAKAADMRSNNYFSHTSPTYGSPFDMMAAFGVTYRYAGENIAMGQKNPQEVMTAWMNSAGHRANILSANFNYIGVGFDNNYWVQEFIGK